MSREDLARELLALGARAEADGYNAAGVVLVALSALIHVNGEMELARVAHDMMGNLRAALLAAGVTVSPEVKEEHDRVVSEADPLNDWGEWEHPAGD